MDPTSRLFELCNKSRCDAGEAECWGKVGLSGRIAAGYNEENGPYGCPEKARS